MSEESLALQMRVKHRLGLLEDGERINMPAFVKDVHELLLVAIAADLAAPVAEPVGWRNFLVQLSLADGGMVNGNRLSRAAKDLLAAPQGEGK
jgi:hypothetical protein